MNEREKRIQSLIERSSLGSREARTERAKIAPAVGRQIARAAISGRYTARTNENRSPKRQG